MDPEEFYKNLRTLRDSNLLLDFSILVNDEEYKTHRVILAAYSDYFRAMFAHKSVAEYHSGKVTFNDISNVAMRTIIGFIYGNELDLNVDNVQEVLVAASKLQMDSLCRLCVEFISEKIDVSNCLGTAVLADRYSIPDLFDTAFKFTLGNFADVVLEREFLELDKGIFLKIISHDELNVEDEVLVFDAIIDWISFDKEHRYEHLERLMEHVRFASIEPIRLVAIEKNELIRNSTNCSELIHEVKNYLLLKDHPDYTVRLPAFKLRNCLTRKKQRIYAVGGWTDEFKSIASAEVYNRESEEWVELEPMAQKRCGVGLTTLHDSIYAVGGHDGQNYLSSVERFDVPRQAWFKDVADMQFVRTSVCVTTLDGHIYAIGGQICSGATDKVEKYNADLDEWTDCRPLNQMRLGAGVAVLDGYIYVIGGSSHSDIFNSVERYDPHLDEWSWMPPMKTARKHLGCTTCNNKIYAVGGRNASGELDSAECYDPTTSTWSDVPAMHMKRCGIGLVELDGSIYAIGGQNEDARLNVVEAFNPKTMKWTWKKSMQHGRLGGGMTVHPSIV